MYTIDKDFIKLNNILRCNTIGSTYDTEVSKYIFYYAAWYYHGTGKLRKGSKLYYLSRASWGMWLPIVSTAWLRAWAAL